MLVSCFEWGLISTWRQKAQPVIPHTEFTANYAPNIVLPTSNAFNLLFLFLCFNTRDNSLDYIFNVVTRKKSCL